MPWDDQNPPSTNVIARMPLALADMTASMEIDQLPDESYRLTGGTLFGSELIAAGPDLARLTQLMEGLAVVTDRESGRRLISLFKADLMGASEQARLIVELKEAAIYLSARVHRHLINQDELERIRKLVEGI